MGFWMFLVLSFQDLSGPSGPIESQEALGVQPLPLEGLPAEAPVGPPAFLGDFRGRPAALETADRAPQLFRRRGRCSLLG